MGENRNISSNANAERDGFYQDYKTKLKCGYKEKNQAAKRIMRKTTSKVPLIVNCNLAIPLSLP
jgi:hypothetical protein